MPASALERILAHYRATSQTEREKGSYFEELIRTYIRYEASYAGSLELSHRPNLSSRNSRDLSSTLATLTL